MWRTVDAGRAFRWAHDKSGNAIPSVDTESIYITAMDVNGCQTRVLFCHEVVLHLESPTKCTKMVGLPTGH
jgi:hypothetical protein